MQRRSFLKATSAGLVLQQSSSAFQKEEGGSSLPAIEAIREHHFPSRVYQFVWRNWELANLDRMAKVVEATTSDLENMAQQMGLPRKRHLSEDYLKRIYITVIRQNWHLLSEAQLIGLLGWDRERFAFTLKEDDFLDHKLGNVKPRCTTLRYALPSREEKTQAESIGASLKRWFPEGIKDLGQPRFAFIEELSRPPALKKISSEFQGKEIWSPRYIYSYFALYGDPLLQADTAGLPDGYLEQAAASGVTGVWIQAVLNNLAPAKAYPAFGKDSDIRLKNLQALVVRAARYGLKIYLYLNEPRAMPREFFKNHEEIRGEAHRELYSMCTSTKEVRDWLRDSLGHVFRSVPQLGGVFSITMSENHTNCFSHGAMWGNNYPVAKQCPRCSQRKGGDVIAELIHTFRDGVRAASKDAEIITWDWGWGTRLAEDAIPKLPKDTAFLSISEWSQPVHRSGVKTVVGEYSISVVGPGPRAKRHWSLARAAGLRAMAKTQFNNTWEISAVPYIPVLPLVMKHCENLAKAGIEGVMASWTCGGYPSPNLHAAAAYAFEPRPSMEKILRSEAERLYGSKGAEHALSAWQTFGDAFQLFPYGVAIYVLPTQHGPANLLRLQPLGLKPGMILFPYDDYKSWSGAYPAAAVRDALIQLSARWSEGLATLEKAVRLASNEQRPAANLELAIARTCASHFESVGRQIEFYLLRDDLPKALPEKALSIRQRMIAAVQREQELAKQQFLVSASDSRIGFEATNHYYYTPLDLLEKMLNCDYVLGELNRA
jgi:hypothetical protein